MMHNVILILFMASGCILSTTGQSYAGCDFSQYIAVGRVYPIYSPGYDQNQRYPPGTNCRWMAYTDPNYQLIVDCREMSLPSSNNCVNDRLVISRSGLQSLADGERQCTTAFYRRSFSNQIVVALQTPANSPGGYFRCDVYAVNTCDCGRRKLTRIVGGTETLVNEFPSMAGLINVPTRELICGASIISERYLLTAAHCLSNRRTSDLAVLVGDHDYNSGTETPYARLYPLESVTPHEAYSPSKKINDIALLRTTQNIEYNVAVGPVCLPFRFAPTPVPGRTLEALGWGTQEFGGPISAKLMKVTLTATDQATCSNSYPGSITSGQFCTYQPGKDTCQYDSGGPLDYTENSLLYLIGLISYGQGCATNVPSVNTAVVSYLNWITSRTPGVAYCER